MNEETKYFGRDLEAMAKAVNYNNWIIDEFNGNVGKTVAEIGAGCGNFTESLLASGVQKIIACEPSDNMFELLKKRFENDNRVCPVSTFFCSETLSNIKTQVDSVMYVNVLEHIEDDSGELRKAYELMPVGSKLLLYVPAMPQLMSKYDRMIGHHRRYTSKDLKNKVKNAGFKIVKCRYFDYLGVFAWFFSMKVLRCDLHKGSVSVYDNFVVPLVKPVEKIIHMPFGKSLLLIAEK